MIEPDKDAMNTLRLRQRSVLAVSRTKAVLNQCFVILRVADLGRLRYERIYDMQASARLYFLASVATAMASAAQALYHTQLGGMSAMEGLV
jgi:hypothetical protein